MTVLGCASTDKPDGTSHLPDVAKEVTDRAGDSGELPRVSGKEWAVDLVGTLAGRPSPPIHIG